MRVSKVNKFIELPRPTYLLAKNIELIFCKDEQHNFLPDTNMSYEAKNHYISGPLTLLTVSQQTQ